MKNQQQLSSSPIGKGDGNVLATMNPTIIVNVVVIIIIMSTVH